MLKYVTLASPTPQTLPRIFVLFQHAVKRYGIKVPTHFQLFSRTKGIAACNLNCSRELLQHFANDFSLGECLTNSRSWCRRLPYKPMYNFATRVRARSRRNFAECLFFWCRCATTTHFCSDALLVVTIRLLTELNFRTEYGWHPDQCGCKMLMRA